MGCGSVQAGQTICIPVTITAVDSLVAAEFTIGFNQLAFDFVSISNLHPEFDQPLTVNPVQSQGRIKVLWLSSQVLSGTNFNAGDVLFEICLKAKAPGSYPINFIGSGENLFLAYGSNGEAIIPSISGCSIQVTPASTLDAFFQACYNKTNMEGTVTVIGYGGTPPYNVSWTGPQNNSGVINNSGDTLRIMNLDTGTYTFHIVDGAGADSTKIINLPLPGLGIDLSLNTVPRNPTCFGDMNGTLRVNPTGGTEPYFIQWSTGDINTRLLDNLGSGIYFVTVTDKNGCIATGSDALAANPIGSTIIRNTPATCPGVNNGYLQVAGAGGNSTNGFYDFEWLIGGQPVNNPLGSVSIRNALPGLYRLRISDGICSDTFDFTVQAKNNVEISVDTLNPISCNGLADGRVKINYAVTTGNPQGPFNLRLEFPNGSQANDVSGTGTFSNLYNGRYLATVIYQADDSLCIATDSFDLIEPEVLDTSSVIIIGESCTTPGNGQIILNPTGGTPGYVYSWDNGQTDSIAINLTQGDYNVTISDSRGCTLNYGPFTITQDRVDVSIDTLREITCPRSQDGSLQVVPGPGVNLQSVSWSNGSTQNTISGLDTGTYVVTVVADNCTSSTSAYLSEPPPMSHAFILTEPTCAGLANGSVGIQVLGGTGPYMYAWSDPN
ncbi:MAG: hypothetical protein KDC57_13170, partial [Saprospiraceae bacterium]|nr:hypothetical protein [Saprospiraceae bacterium]